MSKPHITWPAVCKYVYDYITAGQLPFLLPKFETIIMRSAEWSKQVFQIVATKY